MANTTKMGFQPTEDEVKAFERTRRGTINRRIEPQPWSNGAGLWMWRYIDSPREWDVAWVDGMADDMLDVHCPFANGGRVFWASPRGLKAKAESVRAEKTADGWMWVVAWRAA